MTTASQTSLRLAAEVVKAAYEEALRRHGMLPSTITLISSYAEDNLTALHEEPDEAAPGGG
ncbi:hypothetical protein [Actinomadura hibisca]|uniref:hypothetical protein n=1 Tax=Actinomadura hibisca TaxID=68565 RepID=UPI00083274E6|nr:hypothetical protein [Actinomadura hibisca]